MLYATPESPRIFERDWMDACTRTPWWVVPLLFVPITTVGIVTSLWIGVEPVPTASLVALGFGAWTLSEYWLHRTVFHWEHPSRLGKTFHFFVHGVHHQWPSDQYRLVMPPWVNLGLLFLVVGPVVLAAAPVWGWGFLAGYTCGYMVYDCTHFWLHHGKWSWAVFKRLKAHHMNHHHNRDDRKFGVSSTLWDHVFGTYA